MEAEETDEIAKDLLVTEGRAAYERGSPGARPGRGSAPSGSQRLDRKGLIDPTEQFAGLLPSQLSVVIDLSADEALTHEHVLKRIGLVNKSSTTLLAYGSGHGSLLNRMDGC